MVAEPLLKMSLSEISCSLAKISMVAELKSANKESKESCSLAKISMVAEPQNI